MCFSFLFYMLPCLTANFAVTAAACGNGGNAANANAKCKFCNVTCEFNEKKIKWGKNANDMQNFVTY